MIRRFDEEKPVEDRGYDVFDANGSYLGYCVFYDNEWHVDDDSDISFFGNGTYFSDDHDDWLRMIIGLIDTQNKYNKESTVLVDTTNKIDLYLGTLYSFISENLTNVGLNLYNYAKKIRPNFGASDEEFIRYKIELFKEFPKLKKQYDFDMQTNTLIK